MGSVKDVQRLDSRPGPSPEQPSVSACSNRQFQVDVLLRILGCHISDSCCNPYINHPGNDDNEHNHSVKHDINDNNTGRCDIDTNDFDDDNADEFDCSFDQDAAIDHNSSITLDRRRQQD